VLHYATYHNSQFGLDFDQPVQLTRQQAVDFADDLLGLDLFFPHLGHTELKVVGPSDLVAKINKDHTLQQVKLNDKETTNIYADLNALWGVEYTFTDYIASLVSLINKEEILLAGVKTVLLSQSESKQSDIEPLKLKANELVGDSGAKYIENFYEASQVEATLQRNDQRDQSMVAVEELRKELSELDEKVSQARSLIRSQQELDQSLQKYSYLLNKDLDTDAQTFVNDIAQIRKDQLQEQAKSDAFVRALSGEKQLANPKRANFLIALALVMLAIGVGLSALSGNLLFGVVAIFIGVAEVGLWWAVNQIAPATIFNMQVSAQGLEAKQQKTSLAAKVFEKLKFLEKFFVDKAWVKALQAESENLKTQVDKRLEGADYAELMTARHALLQTIATLAFSVRTARPPTGPKSATNTDSEPVSVSDPIESRRKLDLLRLERARLESDLREQDNFGQLVELSLQVGESVEPEVDVSKLGLGVAKLRLGDKDELLALKGEEWEQYQPDRNQLIQLYWRLLLPQWQANPAFPLLRLTPASVTLDNGVIPDQAQLISIQVQGE
jgi:hypothetical protein